VAQHARRRIINAIKQNLMNLPTTGTNVYEDPAAAVDDDSLPALVIEPLEEEVSTLGDIRDPDSGYKQVRTLSLAVSVLTKSIDVRDTCCVEVEESVIHGNVGINRRITRTEFETTSAGAHRLWTAQVVVEVDFLTEARYPRLTTSS
jgi:hypothetical protein